MFLSEQTDWIREAYSSGADCPDGRLWRVRGRCVRLHDLHLYHPDTDCRLGHEQHRGRVDRHRLAVVIGHRGMGGGRYSRIAMGE